MIYIQEGTPQFYAKSNDSFISIILPWTAISGTIISNKDYDIHQI